MQMLGKTPATYRESTKRLSAYLDLPKLPPLPAESDWFKKVSKFSMAGNDQYGNCVVAGAAHMVQTWTANAGRHETIIPDKQVIDAYLKLTGGQDTGLNMLAFLDYWQKVGIFGNKIGGYVSVNPRKITQMQYANYLFGGVFTGFLLPLSSQNQAVWEVPVYGPVGRGEPESWGGHCAPIGVTSPHAYTVSTWGVEQPATPGFVATYSDEAYAILTLDWFTVTHKTPYGFAYRDLLSDLKAVQGS